MDLVNPRSQVTFVSPADDPAYGRAERLGPAREALLGSAPHPPRLLVGRKPRRKFLEIRPRLLTILERVVEKGSDRHVWLVLDAVALLTAPSGSDTGGAEDIADALRRDQSLYDDGDEWIAGVQRLQMMPVWMIAMVAFGLPLLLVCITKHIDLTYYWQAMLGGTVGCFLDWNRSEPRKLSGSTFQQLMLRAFQPFASAIYGLLTVLLLQSGIVNLKPADMSEPIYLFLAAVLAGYGGQHGSDTMQRLTKALSRPE